MKHAHACRKVVQEVGNQIVIVMEQFFLRVRNWVSSVLPPLILKFVAFTLLLICLGAATAHAQQAPQKLKAVPRNVQSLTDTKTLFQSKRPFSRIEEAEEMEASVRERSKAVVFLPNFAVLEKIHKEKPEYLDIQFPITVYDAIELRLYRVEIGMPDMEVRLSGGSIFQDTEGVFYRGIVKGDFESLVAR